MTNGHGSHLTKKTGLPHLWESDGKKPIQCKPTLYDMKGAFQYPLKPSEWDDEKFHTVVYTNIDDEQLAELAMRSAAYHVNCKKKIPELLGSLRPPKEDDIDPEPFHQYMYTVVMPAVFEYLKQNDLRWNPSYKYAILNVIHDLHPTFRTQVYAECMRLQ